MQRINCILLTLMLGAAAVALAAHSTVHLNPGAGQCLMCAGQANLDGAFASPEHPLPENSGFSDRADTAARPMLSADAVLQPQPRAPPGVS